MALCVLLLGWPLPPPLATPVRSNHLRHSMLSRVYRLHEARFQQVEFTPKTHLPRSTRPIAH